jgi:hypothetical protein
LIPQVIAASDDVHAGVKDLGGGFEADARPARGIFAIGDDHVDLMPVSQQRNQMFHRPPSRSSYDVANKQKFHGAQPKPREISGKPNKLRPLIFGLCRAQALSILLA